MSAACGDEKPTWYQDVAPMLSTHCNSCHVVGGIAPFPLDDYDTARARARQMIHQVEIGAMPPFDALEEQDCTPRHGWVEDPRLSQAQKDTLLAWADTGYSLGEEEAIPPPRSQDLLEVSRSMVPVEGFATSGDRDQFICYILDPGVHEPVTWLTGLQVKPELPEVVHHAVITSLPAGAQHDALIAEHGIGRPYDCGINTPPGDFQVHVWTPGNQPMQMQPGIAIPLAGGSKLVMQVHYHPGSKVHKPDRTSIDLRFTSEWPSKIYVVHSMGNQLAAPQLQPGPNDRGGEPTFFIPANAVGHTEHMRMTVPPLGHADVRIYSVNPHLHLVGTHVSATLERPAARGKDPAKECVANGGWNFDWQRTYIYDRPFDELPTIAEGDVLDLKCTWNNTISNPFVQRMLLDANLPPRPIDLFYGEETNDEMCLEIFGLAVDAPPPPTSRHQPFVMPSLLK
jgi:hypothetical protein